jgi:hypothetical protein
LGIFDSTLEPIPAAATIATVPFNSDKSLVYKIILQLKLETD